MGSKLKNYHYNRLPTLYIRKWMLQLIDPVIQTRKIISKSVGINWDKFSLVNEKKVSAGNLIKIYIHTHRYKHIPKCCVMDVFTVYRCFMFICICSLALNKRCWPKAKTANSFLFKNCWPIDWLCYLIPRQI